MALKFVGFALATASLLAATGSAGAGGKAVACYEEVVHPATYRTVEETVQVKPAESYTVVRPAVHGVRYRIVEVEPARTIERVTPAVVKVVHRKVKVQPAGHVWTTKHIDGKRVLCKVEHPAVWKTVAETIVVKPERVTQVTVPARHEKIAETVVIEPERHERVVTPAEYGIVKKRVLVDAGGSSWRKIKLRNACKR
ncbi:MAG: hypothetical protein IPL47_06075 [Phyllobacteriaceae bacterium]|nr:hypothetical protein [Phyllobacteriaceae bacterium]